MKDIPSGSQISIGLPSLPFLKLSRNEHQWLDFKACEDPRLSIAFLWRRSDEVILTLRALPSFPCTVIWFLRGHTDCQHIPVTLSTQGTLFEGFSFSSVLALKSTRKPNIFMEISFGRASLFHPLSPA